MKNSGGAEVRGEVLSFSQAFAAWIKTMEFIVQYDVGDDTVELQKARRLRDRLEKEIDALIESEAA